MICMRPHGQKLPAVALDTDGIHYMRMCLIASM